MDKQQYEKWSRTIAFALKMVGILGIIFVPVFWALTGRVELAFLPFFGTLAGVGQGLDVLKEISQNKVDAPTEDTQNQVPQETTPLKKPTTGDTM